MALLTYQQQQAIKPIGKNNQLSYPQIQIDTENLYLAKILGVVFAQKVQEKPLDYADLLNGSEFTYCGETISHKGLRYVLAYYTYAEYSKVSDVNDTYTGLVQQNRTETTHLSTGRINAICNTSLSIADQALEIVKLYLNENSSSYPFWSGCKSLSKPHSPKLFEIRNT